jgi:hypothetical protein
MSKIPLKLTGISLWYFLCNTQGIYDCDCADQAEAWRLFLEKNKLVTQKDNEPESLSY